MGRSSDVRREVSGTRYILANFSQEQGEMAWNMFVNVILKTDNYEEEEEENVKQDYIIQ